MQRSILRHWLTALALTLLSSNALAQKAPQKMAAHGNTGLGVVIGVPTAVTGKFFLDQRNAIDAGLALSFNETFLVYGDYLMHFRGAFGRKNAFLTQTTPYLGFGGLFAFTTTNSTSESGYRGKGNGAFGIAVRIPFGAEWRLPDPSLGVFVELVPGISLFPQTTSIFQGGVGIRYYF